LKFKEFGFININEFETIDDCIAKLIMRICTANVILLSSGGLARELVQTISENAMLQSKILDHLVFFRQLNLHSEWMKTNPLGKRISNHYNNLEGLMIDCIQEQEKKKMEKTSNIEASIT